MRQVRRYASVMIGVLVLAIPSHAASQGYTAYESLLFQSLNQNMWGGGGPGSISYNAFLGLQWNESLSVGGIAGSSNTVIIPGGCVIWCWDPVTADTRTGAKFTGQTDGKIGLQVGATINSGTVDVTMPVTASLRTSAFSTIAPGGLFSIGTDYAVDPSASLHTLFPSMETYADFVFDVSATGTGEACFIGVGCAMDTGTFIDIDKTFELASVNRDGSNEFRVLGATVSDGVSFDVGPVSGQLDFPNLETDATSDISTLISSGEANVLDLGVDVPSLIADAVIPGSGYLLSGSLLGVDYSVLSASMGPRFGIGQDFTFTSTPMTTLTFDEPVSPVVNGVVGTPVTQLDAALGSQLDFIFPEALSLSVTPTYWLQNTFYVNTDFLSRLALSLEVLGIHTPIGDLGPLYEDDFQTNPVAINLDSRQFALDFDQFQGTTFEIVAQSSTVTPEPSSWILLATGLLVVAVVASKRRRKAAAA